LNFQDIFPSQIEPFCLGIGNQVTDTEVYQAFNLPLIFIVDEQGSIVVHQNGTNGKKMMKTSNYIEIRENIEQWLPTK
jgi:phosphatidate phosphatase PAH1